MEQIRRFELLRLAIFALKLRKLDQRFVSEQVEDGASPEVKGHGKELEFRRSLLRHVIFPHSLVNGNRQISKSQSLDSPLASSYT
jgi:hypothetical protein